MNVLLSSTILDLKDLRNILERDLTNDGHEVVTSEGGTVRVDPGQHSYELCLSAVKRCDCLIAVIDGRFGGEYPEKGSGKSITEKEIETALEHGKITLVFVRQSVWECRTTQRELLGRKDTPYKAVKNIVEDPRIFGLIDRIAAKPTDNWIFQFNMPTDLLRQIRAQIGVPKPDIDWLQRSRALLADRQERLTSNGLGLGQRHLDDVYVPLGLMERKQQDQVGSFMEKWFATEPGISLEIAAKQSRLIKSLRYAPYLSGSLNDHLYLLLS
jgi:hypothetical protein